MPNRDKAIVKIVIDLFESFGDKGFLDEFDISTTSILSISILILE